MQMLTCNISMSVRGCDVEVHGRKLDKIPQEGKRGNHSLSYM